MPKLNTLVQAFLEKIEQLEKRKPFLEEEKIQVDEVASKLALLYEKIRNIIDYGEEQTLRKRAIKRLLNKWLLVVQDRQALANLLVKELIRGGHLPQNQIPRSKVDEVACVLEKYFKVANLLFKENISPREKLSIQSFWLGIVSAWIDDILNPNLKFKLFIEFAISIFRSRTEFKEGAIVLGGMPLKEKEQRIKVAVERIIFRLDEESIVYSLLKEENFLDKDPQDIASKLKEKIAYFLTLIRDDLSARFYRKIKSFKVPFWLLQDIFLKNKTSIQNLEDQEWLFNQVRSAYKQRVLKLKKELLRIAIYVTISIFITKALIAFAIEVPLEALFAGGVQKFPLVINILTPPLLMLILAITVKAPSPSNFVYFYKEILKVLYQDSPLIEVNLIKKSKGFSFYLVYGFYWLIFFFSFSLVFRVLRVLDFNLFSMGVFLFFFSLISYAGVQVRQRAKDFYPPSHKEGFFLFILETLSLPFLIVGRWFSKKISSYNILVFIDILIELPLSILISFLEQWRAFLREKREEIEELIR